MRRRSLWIGTFTLTGAAVVSRALGLLYRIFLARFLGAEGLGFYQMVFPLYVTSITIALLGTPLAIAQMVGEGRVPPRRLVRHGLATVMGLGLPLAVGLVWLAKPLALTLYHEPRLAPLIPALAPALLAVLFSGVLRGYFIGQQNMMVPAAAQVSEQVARLGVLWVILAVPGIGKGAQAPVTAVLLLALGEAVALMVLANAYAAEGKDRRATPAGASFGRLVLARRMLALGLPVASSRLAASLIGVIQAGMIPERLVHSGLTRAQAVAFFGQLTGMALPLIFFPTTLASSLSTNLVPAMAEAKGRGDRPRMLRHFEDAMYATALLSFPVTAIFLVMGPNLDYLLFGSPIPPAVFLPLAVGGLFLYFDITVSGIVRGLGRTEIPMLNDLLASCIEMAVIWVWGGSPGQGREMVSMAMGIGFVIATLLDFRAALRLLSLPWHQFPWRGTILRPAVAVVPVFLVLPVWLHWIGLRQGWQVLLGAAVAGGVYLMGLKASGQAFTRLL